MTLPGPAVRVPGAVMCAPVRTLVLPGRAIPASADMTYHPAPRVLRRSRCAASLKVRLFSPDTCVSTGGDM